MNPLLKKPSFYGFIATGILIIFIIYRMYKQNVVSNTDYLLLGILVGVHSLLHYYMEVTYNYNPLESGKLF